MSWNYRLTTRKNWRRGVDSRMIRWRSLDRRPLDRFKSHRIVSSQGSDGVFDSLWRYNEPIAQIFGREDSLRHWAVKQSRWARGVGWQCRRRSLRRLIALERTFRWVLRLALWHLTLTPTMTPTMTRPVERRNRGRVKYVRLGESCAYQHQHHTLNHHKFWYYIEKNKAFLAAINRELLKSEHPLRRLSKSRKFQFGRLAFLSFWNVTKAFWQFFFF